MPNCITVPRIIRQFFSKRVLGSFPLSKSIFADVPQEKICENSARVMTQAVLVILPTDVRGQCLLFLLLLIGNLKMCKNK